MAPVITGLIVQHTGSFTPALFTGAGMSLASAIIYLVFVRAPVTIIDSLSAVGEGLATH